MAYIFDPLRNTFIDDEDTSLGNKLALLDDDLEKAIREIGEKYGPDAIKTLDQLPENKPAEVEQTEQFNRFNKLYEDGGMVRQNFGDGTPTKRADGKYSVRLYDFSKPVGPDGQRPRITYIGTLSYIKNIIKQNKKQANLARLEQGAKSSEARATWLKGYSLDNHEADIKIFYDH